MEMVSSTIAQDSLSTPSQTLRACRNRVRKPFPLSPRIYVYGVLIIYPHSVSAGFVLGSQRRFTFCSCSPQLPTEEWKSARLGRASLICQLVSEERLEGGEAAMLLLPSTSQLLAELVELSAMVVGRCE
jgi:hypothetical protein